MGACDELGAGACGAARAAKGGRAAACERGIVARCGWWTSVAWDRCGKSVAGRMPEVHIVGELVGATDFAYSNLFCKFELHAGAGVSNPAGAWTRLDGVASGQTQQSLAEGFNKEFVVWNHPIDVHYSTTTLGGWPVIVVQVWHEDSYGRLELSGYGVTHVPSEVGEHVIECVLWRPQGSFSEKVVNFFMGTTSHLEHRELVSTSEDRWDLFTETAGSVHFKLDVMTRGFRNKGVVFNGADDPTLA